MIYHHLPVCFSFCDTDQTYFLIVVNHVVLLSRRRHRDILLGSCQSQIAWMYVVPQTEGTLSMATIRRNQYCLRHDMLERENGFGITVQVSLRDTVQSTFTCEVPFSQL